MVHCWIAMEARGGLEWERGGGPIESLWGWGRDGPLHDVRGGGGEPID